MRNSKLKEEYMKEESFWHITNKKNLKNGGKNHEKKRKKY